MDRFKYAKVLLSIVFVQIFCMPTAFANHSWVLDGKGGSMRVINREHPSVRMVREWIRMDIYENYYVVKAQFEFYNDGPPVTVKMGFPEINERENNSPGFAWFKNWLDGKRIGATRILESEPNHLSDFFTVYLWTTKVHFRRGQTRNVRVEYRAQSGIEMEGWRIAAYDFTGENWRNSVRETNFVAVMHVSGVYRLFIEAPSCLRINDNRLSGRWTDWPADERLMINYAPTLPEAVKMTDGAKRDIELYICGQCYMRLPGAQKEPVILPDAVTKDDLLFVDSHKLYDFFPRGECTYESTTIPAPLKCGGNSVIFSEGVPEMDFNGSKIPLPQAPFKVNGRNSSKFYVPAKKTVESLGGKISYDSRERWLRIFMPGSENCLNGETGCSNH